MRLADTNAVRDGEGSVLSQGTGLGFAAMVESWFDAGAPARLKSEPYLRRPEWALRCGMASQVLV